MPPPNMNAMKNVVQLFLSLAVLCLARAQNAECLFDASGFEDHLTDATQNTEDFLEELINGFDTSDSSYPDSTSLYNYTRALLELNYTVRNEIEFTRATRTIVLSAAAATSGAVEVDTANSIWTIERLFDKAEAGENYDVVELRTHLGYLITSKLAFNTPKHVNEFFASLTLTRIGICFGLAKQVYTVAFVVDDTGSMSGEIAHVQRLITDFVRSGAASPSHYILTSFNDPNVGVPHKYTATSETELDQLLTDVNALSADGGGDCPELAMTGMLNALNLSSVQGHIIVLTDAGPKDINLTSEVISRATELQVTIHFSLSTPLCSNGSEFYRISKATGGIVIEDLTSLNALSDHLNTFFKSEFVSVTADGNLSPISNDTIMTTCKNISVSEFVRAFSLGIAPTPGGSANIDILSPSGTVVSDVTLSSLVFYTFENPTFGFWLVCSSDVGLSVTRTDITDFDLTVQFLEYSPDTDSVYLSPYTPRNTSNGVVYVFSSRLDDLSTELTSHLDVVDTTGSVTSQIDLIMCPSNSMQSLQGEFTIPQFHFELSFTGYDREGRAVLVNNPIQYEPLTIMILCNFTCENGGICVVGGKCKCSSGWGGPTCSDFACACGSGQACTGPGICTEMPAAAIEVIVAPIAAIVALLIIVTVVTALIIFVKYKRTHQKRGKAPAYLDIYTLPDIVKANSDVLDANSSSNFDSLEEGDVGGFNSTSSIFQ